MGFGLVKAKNFSGRSFGSCLAWVTKQTVPSDTKAFRGPRSTFLSSIALLGGVAVLPKAAP